MSTVIINDETMEAEVGERLLNVARRHAAHIGFACDNAGTCQACRCRVLSGAEHLSPPTDAEKTWIPAERLAEGQRLACQVTVKGPGPVQVISWAEELRRLAMGIISPPAGENGLANLQRMASALAQLGVDQLLGFPANVINTFNRVGPVRFVYPVINRDRLLRDASRVVERMRGETGQIEQSGKKLEPVPIAVE